MDPKRDQTDRWFMLIHQTPVAARTRAFDDNVVNAPPSGFSLLGFSGGATDPSVVRAEAGPRSELHTLGQRGVDPTDHGAPGAVMTESSVHDVRVCVGCKGLSGPVEPASGLVPHGRDENRCFVISGGALRDNTRVDAVRDGRRQELASCSGRVAPTAGQDDRLDVRADRLDTFSGGPRAAEHDDGMSGAAGRVGVSTKADSVTSWEDLRAEPL